VDFGGLRTARFLQMKNSGGFKMSISPFPWAFVVIGLIVTILPAAALAIVAAWILSWIGIPFWLTFFIVLVIAAFNIKL
jgi:hypothetical protein